MVYDAEGRLVNPRLGDYRIFAADETPELIDHPGADLRAVGPLRGQGHRRDPHGRRGPCRRQRDLRRHGRAHPQPALHAGAGVACLTGVIWKY